MLPSFMSAENQFILAPASPKNPPDLSSSRSPLATLPLLVSTGRSNQAGPREESSRIRFLIANFAIRIAGNSRKFIHIEISNSELSPLFLPALSSPSKITDFLIAMTTPQGSASRANTVSRGAMPNSKNRSTASKHATSPISNRNKTALSFREGPPWRTALPFRGDPRGGRPFLDFRSPAQAHSSFSFISFTSSTSASPTSFLSFASDASFASSASAFPSCFNSPPCTILARAEHRGSPPGGFA